jgi:trimeric autotransporter adhesin
MVEAFLACAAGCPLPASARAAQAAVRQTGVAARAGRATGATLPRSLHVQAGRARAAAGWATHAVADARSTDAVLSSPARRRPSTLACSRTAIIGHVRVTGGTLSTVGATEREDRRLAGSVDVAATGRATRGIADASSTHATASHRTRGMVATGATSVGAAVRLHRVARGTGRARGSAGCRRLRETGGPRATAGRAGGSRATGADAPIADLTAGALGARLAGNTAGGALQAGQAGPIRRATPLTRKWIANALGAQTVQPSSTDVSSAARASAVDAAIGGRRTGEASAAAGAALLGVRIRHTGPVRAAARRARHAVAGALSGDAMLTRPASRPAAAGAASRRAAVRERGITGHTGSARGAARAKVRAGLAALAGATASLAEPRGTTREASIAPGGVHAQEDVDVHFTASLNHRLPDARGHRCHLPEAGHGDSHWRAAECIVHLHL